MFGCFEYVFRVGRALNTNCDLLSLLARSLAHTQKRRQLWAVGAPSHHSTRRRRRRRPRPVILVGRAAFRFLGERIAGNDVVRMLVAVVLAGGALLPNKQTNAQMHENNMLQLSVQRQRHSFAQWREWHRTMAIHSSMSNGTVAHSPLVSSPTTSLPICISRTRCTSPSRSSGSRCSCAAACICVSGEVFCVCSYLSCIYLRARGHIRLCCARPHHWPPPPQRFIYWV